MVERKMQTLNFAINNYDQKFFLARMDCVSNSSKHQSELSCFEISNLAPKPPPMRRQGSHLLVKGLKICKKKTNNLVKTCKKKRSHSLV